MSDNKKQKGSEAVFGIEADAIDLEELSRKNPRFGTGVQQVRVNKSVLSRILETRDLDRNSWQPIRKPAGQAKGGKRKG